MEGVDLHLFEGVLFALVVADEENGSETALPQDLHRLVLFHLLCLSDYKILLIFQFVVLFLSINSFVVENINRIHVLVVHPLRPLHLPLLLDLLHHLLVLLPPLLQYLLRIVHYPIHLLLAHYASPLLVVHLYCALHAKYVLALHFHRLPVLLLTVLTYLLHLKLLYILEFLVLLYLRVVDSFPSFPFGLLKILLLLPSCLVVRPVVKVKAAVSEHAVARIVPILAQTSVVVESACVLHRSTGCPLRAVFFLVVIERIGQLVLRYLVVRVVVLSPVNLRVGFAFPDFFGALDVFEVAFSSQLGFRLECLIARQHIFLVFLCFGCLVVEGLEFFIFVLLNLKFVLDGGRSNTRFGLLPFHPLLGLALQICFVVVTLVHFDLFRIDHFRLVIFLLEHAIIIMFIRDVQGSVKYCPSFVLTCRIFIAPAPRKISN